MTLTEELIIEADPSVRMCAEPGCETPLPEGAHRLQRYCADHFRGGNHGKAKPQAPRGRPKKDVPPKVVIDLGSGPAKGDAVVKRTEAGAKAFMGVVSMGVAMSGDVVCAKAISSGSDDWARSIGELSKYQPILTKIFAPTTGGGQGMAWLALAMSSSAIVIPVLAHHNLLPESIAAKLGGVMVAATVPSDGD